MKYFYKKALILLLLCLFFTNAHAVSETQIKAVFLEKFTHLIQWPTNNKEEFVICVLNNKPFAEALKNIYKNKTFKNRSVKVLNINSQEEVRDCNLLFIGKETKNIDALITHLQNRPVLTISDDKEKIPENVMITMYLTNNKFKYIINNKAAKNSDIKISHLLLRSAQEVIK